MARVLVVDDEESIRETLSEFLRDDGHDVRTAESVGSALAELAEAGADVVVTDIIMPRRSGLELLSALREAAPGAKVVLITGEPTFETAAAALREGAFEYLAKPVTGADVCRVVRAAAQAKAEHEEDQLVRRQSEAERESLLEQLIHAQKMEAVGRLAGGVAHDFNNILTAIRGYAELVLDALGPSDPLHADVLEISRAADRATALTNQLLAFSRRQIVRPVALDVNESIAHAQRMLTRIIGEDIELVFRPGAGLWTVRADPTQIDQVLVNLATNSRDAMPKGGALRIATQNASVGEERASAAGGAAGDYAVLSVRDTGVGMDAPTRQRIFEPFFSTKGPGKGTGLGLSTVYGIVQQCGGFIEVDSTPGRGTVFRIFLPRVVEPVADRDATPTHLTLPRGRERVLLVEDETTVRALARRILERHGYGVVEARDGREALVVADEAGPFDLVLTDLVMPRMRGRELYETLSVRWPELRVVYMTGYPGEGLLPEGFDDPSAGIEVLQKPFTIESLVRAVRTAIDR